MPDIKTNDGVRLDDEETGTVIHHRFSTESVATILSWEPQARDTRRDRCIAYAARGWPPSDAPTRCPPDRRPGAPPTERPTYEGAGHLRRPISAACRWVRRPSSEFADRHPARRLVGH